MSDLKWVEAAANRANVERSGKLLEVRVGEEWPDLADSIRRDRQLAKRNNLALGLGICSVLVLIAASSLWFGAGALGVAAFAGLPCLMAFEKLRRTTVARDHWIVEQPDEGEYLVEIFIEVDGVVMGSDRGIFWFDQEAIHFTGQRTWFRIGVRHIYDLRDRDTLLRPFDELSAGQTTIRVAYPDARVRIKIVEVPVPGRASNHDFIDHIRYLKSLKIRSDEPTTLPPLTLDPEYQHDIFRNTEMQTGNYWSFLVAGAVVALLPMTPFDTFFVFSLAIAYTIYQPVGRLIRGAQVRARGREP